MILNNEYFGRVLVPVPGSNGASGPPLVRPVASPTDTGPGTASVGSARPRKSSVAVGRQEINKEFFNLLVLPLTKM